MPSPVSIILAFILATDLLWWWRADRWARPLRHALPRRLLIGLFMGGQIALVLWTFGGRVPWMSSLGRSPQLLSAAGYHWHLLLLPASWLLVAAAGVLLGVWRCGRRLTALGATSRRAGSAKAGQDPASPATDVPAVRTGETASPASSLAR